MGIDLWSKSDPNPIRAAALRQRFECCCLRQMEVRNDTHEASPLPGEQRYGSRGIPRPLASWSPKQHLEKWWTMYACAVFIIVRAVPSFNSERPKPRTLQLAVCRDIDAADDASFIDDSRNISEKLRRISDLQSTRVRMRGVMAMKEAIAGFLLPTPYGVAA